MCVSFIFNNDIYKNKIVEYDINIFNRYFLLVIICFLGFNFVKVKKKLFVIFFVYE